MLLGAGFVSQNATRILSNCYAKNSSTRVFRLPSFSPEDNIFNLKFEGTVVRKTAVVEKNLKDIRHLNHILQALFSQEFLFCRSHIAIVSQKREKKNPLSIFLSPASSVAAAFAKKWIIRRIKKYKIG